MKISVGIDFLAFSMEEVLKKYGKWFLNYVWELRMVCRWGVAKHRTIGKKDFKLALTIYSDFIQGLSYQILRGGEI